MVNINYVFSVSVESGPSDTFNNKLTIDAYDKISVTVPPSTSAAPKPVPVSLQPVSSDKVKFLCIKSDLHSETKDKKVIYQAAGDTTTTPPTVAAEINLDLDQVLIGSSLIKLLGDVKKLSFTNTCDKDAHIEILVGREI